jgi:hypothetical protein
LVPPASSSKTCGALADCARREARDEPAGPPLEIVKMKSLEQREHMHGLLTANDYEVVRHAGETRRGLGRTKILDESEKSNGQEPDL